MACAPMLLLYYVAGTRAGWREEVKVTLIFSLSRLGAAIVTPLVVGVLSSIIPQWVFKSPKILSIFRRSYGLLFLLLGARIIMSAIGSL